LPSASIRTTNHIAFVIVTVGLLTYFPALALGPIIEHF
jgi:K+-transporting ATPase A subunit